MRLAIIDDDNRVYVVTRNIEDSTFLTNGNVAAQLLAAIDQTVFSTEETPADGTYNEAG